MMKILLLTLISILTVPSLNAETQPEIPTDIDGDGYINLSTLAHLRWLSESPEADLYASYELDNDIDASETKLWNTGDHDDDPTTPDSAMGWKPIRTIYGNIEGNQHSIRNLYIYRPTEKTVAFILSYHSNGRLENMGLENVYVRGGDLYISKEIIPSKPRTGGLLAYAEETEISGCWITGTVIGDYEVGALIGTAWYTKVSKCSSYSKVLGNNTVGGLIGSIHGWVENCYSRGEVYGKEGIGGLLGYSYGIVNNNYSACEMNGHYHYMGGIAATHHEDDNYNSYWDKDVSEVYKSGFGIPRSTVQMKKRENYFEWDFEAVWAIDPTINDGYPYLRGNMPVSSLQENTQDKTASSITLFPNPATSHISILETISPFAEFTIVGMDGINHYPVQVFGNRIEISHLPSGLYILCIKDGDIETNSNFSVR
jgi:hypothetical protein